MTPAPMTPAAHVTAEIASQPETWQRALELLPRVRDVLPRPGQRVAVVGCGTSWFVAQSYAVHREAAGQGWTDAFAASEFPDARAGQYDLVVAISRSGTTTEVLDLLRRLPDGQRTLAVIGDPRSPGASAADDTVLLDFADEQSVVQTRFATSALLLLRAGLGEDLGPVVEQGRAAVTADLPPGWQDRWQFVFLGTGTSVGIAHEAALKMREAALAWSESYPAWDYRHGPIAVAQERTLAWIFGEPPAGLEDQIRATGATVVRSDDDPLASLVLAQRLAVAVALHRDLDPDTPPHLTRSIVLS
ncbi:SIS domain-containing protein [Nakamurella endophytica]|nr:SIS domain-containing protein [Nakamurella endophytica]